MTQFSARQWAILVCGCALALLPALIAPQPAAAQDGGPECPSGFVWQRMSGVGCVQEDCFNVPNAKLSYTSDCICLDGYKPCYEPVDSSGVACGPNCPMSRLVGCVDPDALCPGEQPAGGQPADDQPADDQPANAAGSDPAGTTDGNTPTVSVDNLVKDLEEFLAGQGVSKPTPGKAAAGGAALSALVGAWVLVNAASGANIGDLLRAVQKWRGGPNASAPPGTPAVSKAPPAPAGTKQASSPAIPLSTSGSTQGQKPAGATPASGAAAGATPSSTPAQKQPAQPGKAKPDGTPEVTPQKLEILRRRFQQIVSQKINEGYHVRNTDFVRKAWNQVPGRLLDALSGHQGGQCGDFAEWGRQWSEPMVRELFGKGAIIDYITVDEQTTRVQHDFEDKIDSLFRSNHAATRVTLPNGESYILDYWSAVGDQQVSWGTDVAYQQIFGGPAPRESIQLIPEKEWIKTWREKIGWDDSEVHNLSYAQQQLKQSITDHGSEEAGIQAWRDTKMRGAPDHQMETVINNYHKNGVWWGR
jgi:hypothetical protein